MPLIPALGRQRQEDFYELGTSLVCRVNFRTAKATKKPCLEQTNKEHQEKSDILVYQIQKLYTLLILT